MNDNGMVDLALGDFADGTGFGSLMPSSSAAKHGMVSMANVLGAPCFGTFNPSAPHLTTAASMLLEQHATILTSTNKAITLASTFELQSPAAEERDFWGLYGALLQDAERAPCYAPERIGINLLPISAAGSDATAAPAPEDGATLLPGFSHPSAFGRSRLWYITHYAFIQDLLMRHRSLRTASLLLRWLERTYDANPHHSGYKSYVFGSNNNNNNNGRSRDEVRLMREGVRCALRAGKLADAIRIAESADDGITACMLAASQMRAHPEAWNAGTAVVPLFGEYAHSDEPLEWGAGAKLSLGANNNNNINNNGAALSDTAASGKPWTSNKDRIDHLATLLDWSELGEVDPDEAVIAATLSGNEAVLTAAYDNKRWQDALWVTARCGLVKIFAKAVSLNGEPIAAGAFRDRFEALCPPTADWAGRAGAALAASLVAVCRSYLSTCSATATPLPAAEELQLRLIISALTDDDGSSFNIRPSSEGTVTPPFFASAVFDPSNNNNNNNNNTIPFATAVLITAARAFSDRLTAVNPQQIPFNNYNNNNIGASSSSVAVLAALVSGATRFSYTATIASYCSKLVATDGSGTSASAEKEKAARWCCQLLFTISDVTERAKAAAAVVLAARCASFNKFATAATSHVSSSSSSAVAGASAAAGIGGGVPSSSPTSRTAIEQRRLGVCRQEQWLLQLLRRCNATRYGRTSDKAFAKQLLVWLDAFLHSNGTSPAHTNNTCSPFPSLAADPRGEAQLWRIALWALPKDISFSPTNSSSSAEEGCGSGSGSFASSSASASASAALLSAVAPTLADVAALSEIAADVRTTVAALWLSGSPKAVAEVIAAYNLTIRPTADAHEAALTSARAHSAPLAAAGVGVGAGEDPNVFGCKGLYASLRELAFWSHLASIWLHWDALSTTAVHAADAARDECYGQLEVYAAEERRLRVAITEKTARALSLQAFVVEGNPQCASAVLKAVEICANAALVGVGFPYQRDSYGDICRGLREQIMLVHAAATIAPRAAVIELFTAVRMLRLDAGINTLKRNVAAALA